MITRDLVRKAKGQLNNRVDNTFFFRKLTSPDWIKPLLEEGYLKTPPPSGFWPESEFLVRMAEASPILVSQVLETLPPTDNVVVHRDILNAAALLPIANSLTLVRREQKWLTGRRRLDLILQKPLVAALAHLIAGGQVTYGLAVVRQMLSPKTDANEGSKRGEGEPDQAFMLDSYRYEEFITGLLPALMSDPWSTIDALISLLRTMVSRDQDDPGCDYSEYWQRIITGDGHQSEDRRGALIVAIVTVADRLLNEDPARLSVLLGKLDAAVLNVFKRIALHYLADAEVVDEPLALSWLSRPDLLWGSAFSFEYPTFLANRFPSLTNESKRSMLDLIEHGPKCSDQPDDDEHTHSAMLIRDRLGVISSVLPESDSKILSALVEKYGLPLSPRPAWSSSFSSGLPSPLNKAELAAKTNEQLLEFLNTWEAGAGQDASFDGLANEFRAAVAEDPSRFSAIAADFAASRLAIIEALLTGLREGIRTPGSVFDWKHVLAVGVAVTSSSESPVTNRRHGALLERLAELLSEGFVSPSNGLTEADVDVAWKLVADLFMHPEISPPSGEEVRDGKRDAYSYSINSLRGEAGHAAVRYGLWKRRILHSDDPMMTIAPELAELFSVIETTDQPEISFRAVLGKWYPWLLHADPSWTTARTPKIFPTEHGNEAHLAAAWRTYVVYDNPFGLAFGPLEHVYQAAVKNLKEEVASAASNDRYPERLVEHVVLYYGLGFIPIKNGSLLKMLYQRAPVLASKHVLSFAGHALWSTGGDVPADLLDRLKELWAWRLAAAGQEKSAELASFGYWFASGRFSADWAFENLSIAIRGAGFVTFDHQVVERLLELAKQDPVRSVEALRQIILHQEDAWSIHGWLTEARKVLEEARASNQPEVLELVRQTANLLGSQGHEGFRGLAMN